MPLNKKGKKIMKSMKKQYGAKRGEQVFYATLNKKKLRELRKNNGKDSASINKTYSRI